MIASGEREKKKTFSGDQIRRNKIAKEKFNPVNRTSLSLL